MGAILNPQGPLEDDGLAMAADLGLDWISVPVSWAAFQPGPDAAIRADALDAIVQFASQHQISVMLRISNTPAWARTPQGPDQNRAAQFVRALAERYPEAVEAVELFPGANTSAGWGGPPDPRAYTALFAKVNEQVVRLSHPVLLVAAGLQPLASPPPEGDMDDLEFLQGLYRQGASQIMPVISLSYSELTGDSLTFPQGSEHRVFRHYEEVRRVMVENQNKNGIIWITHLIPPSGTISGSDSAFRNLNAQSSWMAQAYIQARSQLYIGVMMGQSLNPPIEGAAEGVPSLLLSAGQYHPFYSVLRDMISLNKAGGTTIMPGRPKEGNLAKIQP